MLSTDEAIREDLPRSCGQGSRKPQLLGPWSRSRDLAYPTSRGEDAAPTSARQFGQMSRSSSLILVLPRVRASTCLMMTAQPRE